MLELIMFLTLICVAGLGAGCVVSPRLRTMVKGASGLFLEDMTKTPKGAQIVYNQAIEEAQKNYQLSCDQLNRLVGKAVELKSEHTAISTKLEKVEKDCERLAKEQRFDALELKAMERQVLLDKKETYESALLELEPRVDEIKVINTKWQLEVSKLQNEKEKTVGDLELSSQMKTLYAQLDEFRADSGTQKLLASARANVQVAKREAVGAQVVHGNKLETKMERIDAELSSTAHKDYAKQLMDKYSKTN